ncbi:MAG: hypothetical protein DRI94_07500 [Bacteroidetes bacterium]|nr:MAG: hypothetical protein DRI94_07500 [Bacteroidota bacterium]
METFKDKSKDELIRIIKSFQKEQENSKTQKVFKEKIADNFVSFTELKRMFLNHGSIILFIEPESGKIVFANKAAEKFYGYDSEQLMKMTINDINCLTKKELKQKRSDAKTNKQNLFIFKHKIYGGDIKTVEVHSCPVTCCGNELLFSIINDITEEQKHIENIKLLNKRFLNVEKIGSFGFFEWDLITNDIFLSPEIYKIYGIPDNVLNAGEFINKVVHPDDLEFVNKNLESAIKGIKKYHIDHRIIRPDGTLVWLNNLAEIEKDEKGKPIKLIGTVRDITEKKKLETELQKSEQKYRILAENTYDWEYWTDPDGNYKYLSPSCERITGYSPEEFVENPDLLFDIVHPDFKEKVHKHYYDENNKNTPVYSDSFPITNKTGKLRWIQHRCSPVFDKDGNFIGRRGNNRDISDLKLTEFKLKEQNEEYLALNEEYKSTNEDLRNAKEKAEKNELLFKEIFNTVPDPMSISTILTGKYLKINEGFTQFTGYSREETIGKTVEDINLWENTEEREDFIKKLKKDGFVHNFETEFRMKDGRILPGLVSANKFIIDKVPYLLIITRNISELKNARLEIIQSEEKFRNLFNKTADAVYVHPFSESGFANFIEVNDVACKMLGYSKEEFKNLSVKDINVPRDVQKKGSKEARQKFDKNGFSVFETEHLTKEGKKISVEIRSLIFDLSGEKTIMSIVRDISKIKKIQEELKLSEEKFRKAFYTNPDAIAINRLSDGMYIDVNKGLENILNYTKDEVVGKTSAELSIWKYMKDKGILVNELKQKGFAENLEAEFLTKNGETKIGSMSANIIKLRKENCIISITRDITERKKTEDELQKYREHLEDIVKERTDELETSLEEQKVLNDELYESNKELERFNELFIGREFRIKELRDKVEELEKKLQKSK